MNRSTRIFLYALQTVLIVTAVFVSGRLVINQTYEGRGVPYAYLVCVALVTSLCIVLLSRLLFKKLTRPVHVVAEYLQGITQGTYRPLLALEAAHENDVLIETYNAMVETVEKKLVGLEHERDQARAVLESMTEGVVALGPQGQVFLINPAAADFFNVDSQEVLGHTFLDAVRYHELQALYEQVSTTHEAISQELTLAHPEHKVLSVQVVPIGSRSEADLSMVMVFQDVTENYEYERLRKEFVANVSHELKSPLTSIRGLTETLLEGALEDKEHNRNFLERINQDAIRLGRLIDDLLELSRIESKGVGVLSDGSVELLPRIERILKSFTREIEDSHIHVEVDVPSNVSLLVNPDRLDQILINLIENALKYNTVSGSLKVFTEAHGAMLKCSIQDTGVGIPGKHLAHVFERFYRVDKARSRSLGGTGLGLSIVKHLVEGYGGEVSVVSKPGQGSTFGFTLPLA